MPAIEQLEENNVREGFLEHAQYIVLRDELPDHQKLILVIGYHFGMRRGEILNLRWDQVDWDGNVIRLEKDRPKGRKRAWRRSTASCALGWTWPAPFEIPNARSSSPGKARESERPRRPGKAHADEREFQIF